MYRVRTAQDASAITLPLGAITYNSTLAIKNERNSSKEDWE
jgi:hypothetical protein